MPKVHHLSHVVLWVEDLDKMTEFYRDILGCTVTHQSPGRMSFLSPDQQREDHMIALAKGREGDSKILNHTSWAVSTVDEVLEYYQLIKSRGIPFDHSTCHPLTLGRSTVSCYFLDPEGNRIEVFALVDVEPGKGYSGPLDLEKSADERSEERRVGKECRL